jgi:hypothetical protein
MAFLERRSAKGSRSSGDLSQGGAQRVQAWAPSLQIKVTSSPRRIDQWSRNKHSRPEERPNTNANGQESDNRHQDEHDQDSAVHQMVIPLGLAIS